MQQVTLTIDIDVADMDATMALATRIAMEQEGWDVPPGNLREAVALIVNCGGDVRYLAYFAEQFPNGKRGGWVADLALT